MKLDPAYRSDFADAEADRAIRLPRHSWRVRHVPRAIAPRDAEGRDLGARRDAEQHHLGQPHLPGVQPASERIPGRRRDRPGSVARPRRRRRGERTQDRRDDRRRRLLPQCRRAVDRGAGEPRSQHHRDERPRLWRDQAHPGRDRHRAAASSPICKAPISDSLPRWPASRSGRCRVPMRSAPRWRNRSRTRGRVWWRSI